VSIKEGRLFQSHLNFFFWLVGPLATSSLVRSLRDLIKARFIKIRHYSIDDRGTYERSTWSKSKKKDLLINNENHPLITVKLREDRDQIYT